MNINNNGIGKYYFGGLNKSEVNSCKKYQNKEIIKKIEIGKIRPFVYALRHANNLYGAFGRKFSKETIVDFLKNAKPNVPRKALNDHQATIVANIYMKYFGNRNN